MMCVFSACKALIVKFFASGHLKDPLEKLNLGKYSINSAIKPGQNLKQTY